MTRVLHVRKPLEATPTSTGQASSGIENHGLELLEALRRLKRQITVLSSSDPHPEPLSDIVF